MLFLETGDKNLQRNELFASNDKQIDNHTLKMSVVYIYHCRKLFFGHRCDEGLTLETSAFLPFTVANLRFQPSC